MKKNDIINLLREYEEKTKHLKEYEKHQYLNTFAEKIKQLNSDVLEEYKKKNLHLEIENKIYKEIISKSNFSVILDIPLKDERIITTEDLIKGYEDDSKTNV